jgi:hypothetical protein
VRGVLAVLLDTFTFRTMALAHIAAAIVAFGPLMMYPALRRTGETQAMASTHMRMTFPALILLWVLGMGLAGMSEDAYKMSQTWLALSLIDWAILVAVSWFLIRPAITDTSDGAKGKLGARADDLEAGSLRGPR